MDIKIPIIGTRGDLQPFIALAQGLISAGHQVSTLSHPMMRQLVESHDVSFVPIGPDVDMEEVSGSIRQQSRNPWAGLMQAMRFSFEMLEKSHEDILAAIQGADLVIISASSAAGKNEADKLGLPYVSVNLMPWGIHYTEPGRPILKRILYGAIDALAAALTTRPLNNLRRRQGLPPVGPEGFTSLRLDLIPISPAVFPPIPYWPAQHKTAGYWFLDEPAGWQPPDDLVTFIGSGEPPLVICLGAMSRGHAGTIEGAILFVDSIQKAGVRAILQGWEAFLPEMRLPAQIFPAGSIPHSWLLPRAKGIVHHGGFGTTAAGFRAGIPALTIPFVADQFTWGQKVFELGVGPKPIPSTKLDQTRLTAALIDLRENKGYHEAAARLGKQIRSEHGIDQAVSFIQEAFAQ